MSRPNILLIVSDQERQRDWLPDGFALPNRQRLIDAGLEVGRGPRDGLDRQISVVPVGLVKGLEVDTTVVVDPGAIVREESQGARALYVALTRSTQRLSIVHDGVVPPWLAEMAGAEASTEAVPRRPEPTPAPVPCPRPHLQRQPRRAPPRVTQGWARTRTLRGGAARRARPR